VRSPKRLRREIKRLHRQLLSLTPRPYAPPLRVAAINRRYSVYSDNYCSQDVNSKPSPALPKDKMCPQFIIHHSFQGKLSCGDWPSPNASVQTIAYVTCERCLAAILTAHDRAVAALRAQRELHLAEVTP
jgi:hypothetical protein